MAFPLWLLGIPLLAVGVIWLRRRLTQHQRKRARPGACLHCGYDLRASKDRCPECGIPTPTAEAGCFLVNCEPVGAVPTTERRPVIRRE